ncbi:MAG: sensor domain-containing diguanylate cyclase [Clostridiaceae bacterium]|nr:sensor domain-containing diguanylate cyclase [Clostridiaceae bacterium]
MYVNSDQVILEDYYSLKKEFEDYQNLAEKTIENLNIRNIELEKRLDSITNIVEVSKYINSYISDDNLIPMINDMILGILGVTYSSIYLNETDNLIVKASNLNNDFKDFLQEDIYNELKNGKPFIVNSKDSLFENNNEKEKIHSLIGVPITLRDKFMGYIIVEHTLCDFFNYEHIKFISAIANQIGIALENNFLYTKIKESSIRDPLLGIYNRKYFFNSVEDIIVKNTRRKFAVVMVDFDDFKKVNDVFGHQYGDEVLIQTTKLISNFLRPFDILARYGGEELIIYINDCNDFQEVFDRIDAIRIKISENQVKFKEINKGITASFGLSFYPINGSTLQNVISIADNMLYEAKKSGKNKVSMHL